MPECERDDDDVIATVMCTSGAATPGASRWTCNSTTPRAQPRADVVLPSGRSAMFVAKDGAGTRVVRRGCPDLTSVFDLTAEIGTTTTLTFDALAARG